MAGRVRTAKARAQRIDMEYFKRLHPFRRWELYLSVAAPAAAILWVAATVGAGSRAPFSSGPVASAHQVFGRQCEQCHVSTARTFRARVTDNMCVRCHEAPVHSPKETFKPACASCHGEHRGSIRLSEVSNETCEQCHLNLTTASGGRTVAASVGDFTRSHPEFAVRREGFTDRAALKFNHELHLKKDLRGPGGAVGLECSTCHKPEIVFGPSAGPPRRRELMAPVRYARDCAECHALYFDPLIDAPVPHDTPEVVHRFVVATLQRYISAYPAQIGRLDPARGRIPVNFPEPNDGLAPSGASRGQRTAAEWTMERTATAERLLWSKTCAECHTMNMSQTMDTIETRGAGLPRVAPTNIATRWMPHARFDHRPHLMAACTDCHAAPTSRETSDVLMPSIATCQRCHRTSNGAEARCFECHDYHDWRGQDESHRRQAG